MGPTRIHIAEVQRTDRLDSGYCTAMLEGYKPVWGRSSDTQGQAVQSCPHCYSLAGSCFAPCCRPWRPAGLPAVVAAATALPQTPLLLLSFMPQLIHSLALAGCGGWAPSLARTLCGSLFLAGCACVWGGRGNRDEPSFWRGRPFVSFQPELLPGLGE